MLSLKTQKDDKVHEFRISVIIPTYNRQETLELTLKALEEQTLPKKYFEVLVVNDGSTDGTLDFLERYKNRGNLNLTYISKINEGQGIARNTALEYTDGTVILFCQDDIIPLPNFLEEHVKVHQKYFTENFICLGKTTWHPEIEVTPCMLFLEEIGMQFKYPALEKKRIFDQELGLRMADHKFFYTSNLSMKRSLFEKEGFDKRFKKYGWEDIELGFRLEKDQRAVLLYNEHAFAYHHHHLTLMDLLKRMEQVGKSAKAAQKINKELRVIPGILKRMIFRLISLPPSIWFLETRAKAAVARTQKKLPFWLKAYYYALMKRHFLIGLAKK